MPALRKEDKRGRAHRGALHAGQSRGCSSQRREGWKATENNHGRIWANVGGQMPQMQTEHDGSREAGKGAMLELWITVARWHNDQAMPQEERRR
jgi:hypothetical protein